MSEIIGSHRNQIKKDISKAYNELKEFEGKKYAGMKVGGSHMWYYDKGEWKEKKITPDKWEFKYAVTKRRASNVRRRYKTNPFDLVTAIYFEFRLPSL